MRSVSFVAHGAIWMVGCVLTVVKIWGSVVFDNDCDYTRACEVCDNLRDKNELVDCNGQKMCTGCAYLDGYNECTICGMWSVCLGGY